MKQRYLVSIEVDGVRRGVMITAEAVTVVDQIDSEPDITIKFSQKTWDYLEKELRHFQWGAPQWWYQMIEKLKGVTGILTCLLDIDTIKRGVNCLGLISPIYRIKNEAKYRIQFMIGTINQQSPKTTMICDQKLFKSIKSPADFPDILNKHLIQFGEGSQLLMQLWKVFQ